MWVTALVTICETACLAMTAPTAPICPLTLQMEWSPFSWSNARAATNGPPATCFSKQPPKCIRNEAQNSLPRKLGLTSLGKIRFYRAESYFRECEQLQTGRTYSSPRKIVKAGAAPEQRLGGVQSRRRR